MAPSEKTVLSRIICCAIPKTDKSHIPMPSWRNSLALATRYGTAREHDNSKDTLASTPFRLVISDIMKMTKFRLKAFLK